jgi:hypothetical protein
MPTYLVRIIETHDLVGIFSADNILQLITGGTSEAVERVVDSRSFGRRRLGQAPTAEMRARLPGEAEGF